MPSASADRDETRRLREASARRREHSSWTSWGFVFSRQDRERQTLRLLQQYRVHPLAERTVLDVGCGTGSWIRDLIRWGASPERVTGVDLLAEDVATARRLLPDKVRLEVGNAAALRFPAASFDLVLQSTVFTSVLDPAARRAIAAEMLRLVKPDGLVVWYDFYRRNPRNPDVRRVTRREIHALFPECRIDLRRITLAPPLGRWLAPRAWWPAGLLSAVPWLCTHYLGAITKRGSGARPPTDTPRSPAA